jgi:hypothetical protein
VFLLHHVILCWDINIRYLWNDILLKNAYQCFDLILFNYFCQHILNHRILRIINYTILNKLCPSRQFYFISSFLRQLNKLMCLRRLLIIRIKINLTLTYKYPKTYFRKFPKIYQNSDSTEIFPLFLDRNVITNFAKYRCHWLINFCYLKFLMFTTENC